MQFLIYCKKKSTWLVNPLTSQFFAGGLDIIGQILKGFVFTVLLVRNMVFCYLFPGWPRDFLHIVIG